MISKKSLDNLKAEIRKANAKNRYYRNKGEKDLFDVKPLPTLLSELSSTKEVNRYTILLRQYNKRGSMKKSKKGIPLWEKNMLKKVRQFHYYDEKKKTEEKKKKNKDKGFTFLGDDILKQKKNAQYKKTPKNKTPSDYINEGFKRTLSKDYAERCAMFKRNYLWSVVFNLGVYANDVYNLIRDIDSVFFYEMIYLPYQEQIDIDFVYSENDAQALSNRIKTILELESEKYEKGLRIRLGD